MDKLQFLLLILFILQYKVSTTMMDLVAVFRLFVFMIVPLCFCVAAFFRRIKIYITCWLVTAVSRHDPTSPDVVGRQDDPTAVQGIE